MTVPAGWLTSGVAARPTLAFGMPQVEIARSRSSLHEYPPFDTVLGRLSDLPRKQQRLARSLLDEPEVVAFGSVREVASKLGVNATTVLRFASTLGYTGYQAMQTDVRRAYLQHAGLNVPADPIALQDSGSRVKRMQAHHRANLDQAYSHLRDEDLQRACASIEGAHRILVGGEGASSDLARLLIRLLRHVGLAGEFLPMAAVDRELSMQSLTPQDLVVAIVLWLPFRTTLDILELAQARGAQTLVIAGAKSTHIARVASQVLIAPSQGLALTFSVLAATGVMEALVSEVAARRPEAVQKIQQELHDRYLELGLMTPMGD